MLYLLLVLRIAACVQLTRRALLESGEPDALAAAGVVADASAWLAKERRSVTSAFYKQDK
jgi:hypothetical protein